MSEEVSKSKAATKAKNKYNSKAYDRLNIVVQKGQREILQEHAASQGESLNEFARRAMDKAIQHDTDSQPPESPQDGDLVLSELGYDPLAKKPIYRDKHTGKQYFVEQIKKTDVTTTDENIVPF